MEFEVVKFEIWGTRTRLDGPMSPHLKHSVLQKVNFWRPIAQSWFSKMCFPLQRGACLCKTKANNFLKFEKYFKIVFYNVKVHQMWVQRAQNCVLRLQNPFCLAICTIFWIECMICVANHDDFVPHGEPAWQSNLRVTSVFLAFNAKSLFYRVALATGSVVL